MRPLTLPAILLTSHYAVSGTPKPKFALQNKSLVGVVMSIIASTVQNSCHRHLASLESYTMPSGPYFARIICPHYTSECFIYLALAMVTTPPGSTINTTMAMALLFTCTNLALTAENTREWYVRKFGQASVEKRWKMIPLLY
jgi:3-oxo-5-alpha-steroid 4-dehydrogenase 3